ncbi:hypothetical protein GWI33_011246 [Rhynchophorus ferrugineus]|uniref:Uncharacterized protein n=1 Tax=Rhynchophorus ferrugineus TaxID=354439 RepID=A0A834IB84_RHYFE|nr:hypothetical protein GWI33_011246 [Rhynchophorus ferrugineus]
MYQISHSPELRTKNIYEKRGHGIPDRPGHVSRDFREHLRQLQVELSPAAAILDVYHRQLDDDLLINVFRFGKRFPIDAVFGPSPNFFRRFYGTHPAGAFRLPRRHSEVFLVVFWTLSF